MNQWNSQYNGNNYSYPAETSTWKDWLLVMAVLLGIPTTIYVSTKIYKVIQYVLDTFTNEQIWGAVIGAVVLSIVIASIVVTIINGIMNWWDGLWYTTDAKYKAAQTSYNQGNQTHTSVIPAKTTTVKQGRWGKTQDTPAGLIAGERSRPPQAQFFGRFDGQTRESRGLYEERFLNYYEQLHWDRQKIANKANAAVTENEIDDMRPECVQTTTKVTY